VLLIPFFSKNVRLAHFLNEKTSATAFSGKANKKRAAQAKSDLVFVNEKSLAPYFILDIHPPSFIGADREKSFVNFWPNFTILMTKFRVKMIDF